MKLLLTNIKSLLQVREPGDNMVSGKDMGTLPQIENAWLSSVNGAITDFGSMGDLDASKFEDFHTIGLSGKYVLPTWVDSHTHIVFAGPREGEFVDRIKGLSYEEIAARGGGILNSAEKLANISEDDLFQSAMERVEEVISKGTGAIEIKSGYGLSTAAELKMLRVIDKIRKSVPIPVKATFLGAHAYPATYKENKADYLKLVIEEMLPQVAEEGLADYIDAFCENNYFSVDDTIAIMQAGQKHGLKAKIHVNQFTAMGGIKACVDHGALSVDHLEELTKADLDALKGGSTLPVALPSCSFFLSIPYTPARKIIDAGLPLVLATDFNPGSTPSGNMPFVLSLACIKMNMTPAEAINAATINAAAALELEEELGSITKGKRANLIVTQEIPSIDYLPYAFGTNCIDQVILNGQPVLV